MKSVVPPELGLVKTSISRALLVFRDFDNSDPKDLSKRNSSCLPGVLLSWFFDFCKVPSTLNRILDMCTPCAISLCKVQTLADDCACLAPVSFHSLQRESFVLFILSFGIETDSVNTLLVFCVHTCTTLTEEKQLKLILTFTVPSTHNRIHSFMKEK
jgi:hypothetical protein